MAGYGFWPEARCPLVPYYLDGPDISPFLCVNQGSYIQNSAIEHRPAFKQHKGNDIDLLYIKGQVQDTI